MFTNTPLVRIPDDLVLEPYSLENIPGKVLIGPLEMRNNTFTTANEGKRLVGVWSCTPGSFSWQYPSDELQVILDGSAEIKFESGVTLNIKKGDIFVCSQGERCVWTVHETIRKIYHVNAPEHQA